MLSLNLEEHAIIEKKKNHVMLMPKFYCVIDEICMFMYHVNKGVVAARCYDMLVIKKKDKFHV
jgi:hypothetical protein